MTATMSIRLSKRKDLSRSPIVARSESLVDQVIADNPDQVQQYRDGKIQVIGFLVGQCMQLSKGKANPAQVNEILRSKLS